MIHISKINLYPENYYALTLSILKGMSSQQSLRYFNLIKRCKKN